MKVSAGNRVLMLVENSGYPHDPRVRREARALVQAGYQVSIICPVQEEQASRETRDGINLYRYRPVTNMPGSLGFLCEYSYAMLQTLLLSVVVLWREGFDIIHAANPPDTFVLIAALYKLLGKAFIFDHHDLAPEMYRARFGSRSSRLAFSAQVLLEKLSCRLADHVIATNESYKEMEMRRGGVPAERITVVRNGPDLKFMRPVEPDAALRQRGSTIIAFAGVMGVQDGVDYLLRALHHLIFNLGRTDVFCVLIGTGDARPSLLELATQLGLDEYVWFTGWVSDTDYLRYLSSADICVDPDPCNEFTTRSTMLKMMEYMALGKPIVAFDLAEHRYSAQAAALYVTPNDELEFARAIVQLMDDPARRAAMGEFGRRRVETELAWPHSMTKLLSAYESLMVTRGQIAPSHSQV